MNINDIKSHLWNFSYVYLTQTIFTGCFYGIRAIFVLYAISRFALNESQAISLFATFMCLCYGTSLIGGYIADKGLGVKKTIITGSAFSSLGLLCILSPIQDLCFLGLSLTSLGSGFIKPNLLTAAGLMFEDPKDARKDQVYSFLYIAMNFGNLIVPIVCGFVGKIYGWHYGIGMISAVLIWATYLVFKTMRFHPSYREDLTISQEKMFLANISLILLFYLLFKYQEYFHGLMGIIMCGSLIYLGAIFYQCNFSERKDVLTVLIYILLFAFFCTLYEQAGTSLMLFYEKVVDRDVVGTVIPSSVFLSLDPLFVLICGPILLFLSSKYFEKTKPIEGLVKIGYGFLCVAASFGILVLSTYQNDGLTVPLAWIVGAFFIQTIGELWIAPISFSKISQYAPARFKGILMSFWQMSIAYGHYIAGLVAQFSLSNTESLLADNSLEGYRIFFSKLGFWPLCVSLSVFIFYSIRSIISVKSPIKLFGLLNNNKQKEGRCYYENQKSKNPINENVGL